MELGSAWPRSQRSMYYPGDMSKLSAVSEKEEDYSSVEREGLLDRARGLRSCQEASLRDSGLSSADETQRCLYGRGRCLSLHL